MKALLWFATLAITAVGLALAVLHNDGYALIVLPPWRVEVSLNLALLLLLTGFLLTYVALRFIANVFELPERVRAYRARRVHEQGETALRHALKSLFEGRYSHAIKSAEKAWAHPETAGVAALLALRSAHALHDEERVDLWRTRAETHDNDIRLARLMIEAEIATETRRFDDAKRALERLSSASGGGRHIAALRLALRARQSAGEWSEVVRLTRQLEKFKSLTPTQAAPIRLRAYREVLNGLKEDAPELLRYWRAIPSSERREPQLALAGAQAIAASGDCREAAHIVEESLTAQWDTQLILAYAGCEGGDVLSRIAQAEKWLIPHPTDAGLLSALGCLCRQKQLWGKARHYLEASLAAAESSAPSRATHLELARLFDAIEQPEEANRHYRIAALCSAR